MKKTVQNGTLLLKIMKISIMQCILAVICSGISAAFEGRAQEFMNKPVTLSVENTELRKVLKAIENQTAVRFVFSSKSIDAGRKVSLNIKGQHLVEFLQQSMPALGITYRVVEGQIILTPTPLQVAPEKNMPLPNGDPAGIPAAVTVKGKVTARETGEPLPGVSILIKGTSKGTTSAVNGEFSLDVPDNKAILVFSYVGYLTEEVALGNRTQININLIQDSKALNEVVVVGYGTVKKSDLTGSVVRVSGDNAADRPFTSVEQMLQGRAAGVQITQNSGAVGSGMTFSIRGANSVSSTNQPLIVIDGYPVETGTNTVSIGDNVGAASISPGINALSTLNPNDVESIEILKDASSTAIYGSRGSNGVVLITTKRGKEGRDKINYSFRTDFSRVPRKLDVLTTNEYLAFANEANMDKNDGSVAYNNAAIAGYDGINTNWQDLIFRTGVSRDHQVSFSGGDRKLRYSLVLGYLSQDGIVKNSSFDRGTIRLNLDREVNQRFNFGLNFNTNLSTTKAVNQSGSGTDVSSSVVGAALRTLPFFAPFSEDEVINQINGVTNPLTLVEKIDDRSRVTQIIASVFANYSFSPALKLTVRAGLTNTSQWRDFYMPRGTYQGDQRSGYAYNGNGKNFNYLAEYTLAYNKTISGKHSINAVGGYTWQSWINRAIGIGVGGFPNDNFMSENINSGTTVDKPTNSITEWSLASVLGRVNYAYDGRYLVTFTARADGSTRLAEGHKWAFFPSIGVGWNIHNELFARNSRTVSELKLRASYGISGNQSVGVGTTKSRYYSGTAVVGQTLSTVYIPGNIANPLLGWETTAQLNAGVDLGLFNGRLKFTLDYYRKQTRDLLINLPIPASTGYTNYVKNAGRVENKGIELSISDQLLRKDVKWSIAGNISFNRNRIESFDGNLTNFSGPNIGSVGTQPVNIAQVGHPIGAFYGYVIDGIYQTQEEINAGPVDPAGQRPGDFKYKDISGPDGKPDGLISAFDRTFIGNPYPDFFFGLSNDVSWKGISLNVLLQGTVGQDIVNTNRYFIDGLTRSANSNISRKAYENRWTGPGTSNVYPAARSQNLPFQSRFTDFIIEDGSFVRVKSVTLAYAFPAKTIRYVNSLRMFVTGTNLITFTNYSGFDPEINSLGSNALTPGIDSGGIPQFRTFSAGLNIGF